MNAISNYLDIAPDVVRVGSSEFNQNILRYKKLKENLGREVIYFITRNLLPAATIISVIYVNIWLNYFDSLAIQIHYDR